MRGRKPAPLHYRHRRRRHHQPRPNSGFHRVSVSSAGHGRHAEVPGNSLVGGGVELVMGRVPKDKDSLLAVALSGARKTGRVSGEDERSARLAANEAIFRAGNERIRAIVADSVPRTPYICECGDDRCFERVELTRDEYEQVRAHPARFLVSPGHQDRAAGERVVEKYDHFTVVEKEGKGREIAARTSREKR